LEPINRSNSFTLLYIIQVMPLIQHQQLMSFFVLKRLRYGR
jgi:hypothetical protein